MTDQNDRDDRDEGLFTNARREAPTSLVKREPIVTHGQGALRRQNVSAEGFNKLAMLVATGADVQSDSQKLLFMLATFGEGDCMGKFAFTSLELVGASEREFSTQENYTDPKTGETYRRGRTVLEAGVEPTAEGKALGLTASRLKDAVGLLKSKGFAKTTDDGPFAPGTDFHEVSLTEAGRGAAQVSVSRAGGCAEGSGMPSIFDDPTVPDHATVTRPVTDLDSFQGMLSRAKVDFTVDHDDAEPIDISDEHGAFRTHVILSGATDGSSVFFTFDGRSGEFFGLGHETK